MNYVVLENIPNTPEGRAFLKQLRKYLRKDYRMISRGRHSDRKGLAAQLAKEQGKSEAYMHLSLRRGMSCKHAERITCVLDDRKRPRKAIMFKRIDTGGWAYRDEWIGRTREPGYWKYTGDFPTRSAAKAAMMITKGL